MTKQEEIKKAVKTCIAIEWDDGRPGFDGNRLTQKILEVEDTLGVVIKVDRELPKNPYSDMPDSGEWLGYGLALLDLTKAGYVAVEPLIEGSA